MKTKVNKLLKIITTAICCSTPCWFVATSCSEQKRELIPLPFDVPNLIIHGDLTNLQKGEDRKLSLTYQTNTGTSFDADVKISLNGQGSVGNPKKNFNIKLYEKGSDYETKKKVLMQNNWHESHKYTLKANWDDSLSLHNLITSKLWGDLVHQKHTEHLDELLNGGAIDGFPISCYNDDEFLGLYTWDTKKDEHLFNLSEDKTKNQAVLCGNASIDEPDKPHLRFNETIENLHSNGWELVFSSTGSESKSNWIITSFNNFINFVKNVNDATTFKEQINQYTNLTSLIDYFLFVSFAACVDNTSNNIMWVTYDGSHWLPTAYDLSFTFGYTQGEAMLPSNIDFEQIFFNESQLFRKLNEFCKPEIKEEWNILKSGCFLHDNIMNRFNAGWEQQTKKLYDADIVRWPETGVLRNVSWNNLKNLDKFVKDRLDYYLK